MKKKKKKKFAPTKMSKEKRGNRVAGRDADSGQPRGVTGFKKTEKIKNARKKRRRSKRKERERGFVVRGNCARHGP